nr:xyloglucan galactosyltransferase xlt2 [Quercus suber]
MEAESATAFYIPFYAGLAVGKYLWSNSSEEECDWVGDHGFGKISKALSRINGCEVVVGPMVSGGGSLDGFDVGVGCSGLMD